MAAEEGVTVTEVVRRSISTESFLRQAQAAGEKVILLDPQNQQMREVVFR